MYSNSIKVKNYKCFHDKLEGFEKILPINIIIGKNNSGKSTLIDLIENICNKSNSISGIFSEFFPTHRQFIEYFAEMYGYDDNSRAKVLNIYKNEIENKPLLYKYNSFGKFPIFEFINDVTINKIKDYVDGYSLKQIFEKTRFIEFQNYKFRRLNAERDIKPEASNYSIQVDDNGQGVTNIIQQFLNRKDLQKQKLIKNDFLNSLNSIVKPEIEFRELSIQISDKDSTWEICFEDRFGNNIFLSQMGSGIKTIIFVLVSLILIPSNSNSDAKDYIFAFEELENNLHPTLQRKLYHFIKEFALKNKCTFFLTTHSNIGIDLFYNCEQAQLISVNNTNGLSTCKTIIQNEHLNDLLNELGFKASDLLQTNGIIWVEGPSDRIYINKWISLLNNTLIEGVHYSIMFYGGKLLSNLSFKDEHFDEFISLLKINKNAHVLIDKDAKRITDNLNSTKQRIQNEIGENNCWITNGREIENYISESTIRQWLENRNIICQEKINFDKFEKFENILPLISPVYNLNKNGYSKEIVNFITNEDLDILDLKSKIQNLVESIQKWNR
jgi:putative ATP-dependent endonuclease of the OLD family